MRWLKGKSPAKKKYHAIAGHECQNPKCMETDIRKLVWLRRGFMQCETCGEYFVTTEKLEHKYVKE